MNVSILPSVDGNGELKVNHSAISNKILPHTKRKVNNLKNKNFFKIERKQKVNTLDFATNTPLIHSDIGKYAVRKRRGTMV